MLWIGLTGGIACGKSTVTEMLRQDGFVVFDADQIARDVVAKGTPGLKKIVETFGEEVLSSDGSLDRARLGSVVFSDPKARAKLNSITHPAIAMKTASLLQAERDKGTPVVIYDAALIVENMLHKAMDGLIVVRVNTQTQLDRLIARDGLDEVEAQSRIDSQMPLEDKVAVATWVVDNDGTLDATRKQVAKIVDELRTSEAAST